MQATTLRRLRWHALAAHEHTLIDQHPEYAHGPGLVQPAFVATDGHTMGRIFEYRTTFLAFVVQSVGGDSGFLVVAHWLIVDLTTIKSYDHFRRAFRSSKRGFYDSLPNRLDGHLQQMSRSWHLSIERSAWGLQASRPC